MLHASFHRPGLLIFPTVVLIISHFLASQLPADDNASPPSDIDTTWIQWVDIPPQIADQIDKPLPAEYILWSVRGLHDTPLFIEATGDSFHPSIPTAISSRGHIQIFTLMHELTSKGLLCSINCGSISVTDIQLRNIHDNPLDHTLPAGFSYSGPLDGLINALDEQVPDGFRPPSIITPQSIAFGHRTVSCTTTQPTTIRDFLQLLGRSNDLDYIAYVDSKPFRMFSTQRSDGSFHDEYQARVQLLFRNRILADQSVPSDQRFLLDAQRQHQRISPDTPFSPPMSF